MCLKRRVHECALLLHGGKSNMRAEVERKNRSIIYGIRWIIFIESISGARCKLYQKHGEAGVPGCEGSPAHIFTPRNPPAFALVRTSCGLAFGDPPLGWLIYLQTGAHAEDLKSHDARLEPTGPRSIASAPVIRSEQKASRKDSYFK